MFGNMGADFRGHRFALGMNRTDGFQELLVQEVFQKVTLGATLLARCSLCRPR